MQAANSEGLTWSARHRGEPREPWDVERVDGVETSHHLSWADLDGLRWNEVQNLPRHIKLLSSVLIRAALSRGAAR